MTFPQSREIGTNFAAILELNSQINRHRLVPGTILIVFHWCGFA